ncbi:guanine nucleotide-binding protein subunit gamma 3 isoform X2 [Cajanus cajan]|uniref:guanine nucleotide-binding protein subunit gamma 3 isoform X2 n=1 Tax=Cajanus cajan TaxID=3821 RepID=UPI00098D9EAB|nr:guanine nucleotide-binding protein subunit gamma 3 isoform X2 [Cajanus cajan]
MDTTSMPSPKPPPGFPDLYGKRREMAKIHMLEREISFLEEELKSSEGLQAASRCCKEIDDFMMTNSDPLLPTSRKNRKSSNFWKWLCEIPCFNFSWICRWCCDGCFEHLNLSSCCSHCKPCNCCCSCLPTINCCFVGRSRCCKDSPCGCKNCCILPSCNFRWPFPSCCICKCSCSCSCSTCPKVRPRCCCTNSCWNPCCSCC